MRKAACILGLITCGISAILFIWDFIAILSLGGGAYVLITFLYLTPLAWCIPMVKKCYESVKSGEELSLAFKICFLLFVNLIGGILLLIEDVNNSTSGNLTAKLKEIENLRDKGILTQEEYEAKRKQILNN